MDLRKLYKAMDDGRDDKLIASIADMKNIRHPGNKNFSAEFREDQHPRAADGKFTDGTGGAAGTVKPSARRSL